MVVTLTDSIERLGHPLGFKVRAGSARPAVIQGKDGRDVITVEARQLEGHQKEGVVTEGTTGSTWRVTTDEDGHLRGTDLAPFPLGFFNAGLHGDLTNRLLYLAERRSIAIDGLLLNLNTGYYMTGSFFKGTGKGMAEPATIEVVLDSSAATEDLQNLVADAVQASPALAAMRIPVANTFAIYVNGRRRPVNDLRASAAPDAIDPYQVYSSAPSPVSADQYLADLIYKTGEKAEGTPQVAPGDMKTKQIRPVIGRSSLIEPSGATEVDVLLGISGASHFALKTDESASNDVAPSGLSLLSAGIAFCYMTQLSRYIEYQKMGIRGVRLVQTLPFTTRTEDGRWIGGLEPADTHLFLSGDEDDATFERLMTIAEHTCYLHTTLSGALEPKVTMRRA